MIVTNNEHADKQKAKAKKIRSKGENMKKQMQKVSKEEKTQEMVFFLKINEERSDDLRDTCCKPHNMEADGRKTVSNFEFQ